MQPAGQPALASSVRSERAYQVSLQVAEGSAHSQFQADWLRSQCVSFVVDHAAQAEWSPARVFKSVNNGISSQSMKAFIPHRRSSRRCILRGDL